MNKYKQGSAHVVIVVVLVIGLLGALGFIFWQNFLKAKPETAKVQSTTIPAVTGFTVSTWNINIPTSETDFEASVPTDVQSANGIFFLDVTTTAIKAAAAKINCEDTTIGSIYRNPSSDDSGLYPQSTRIGGYYYGFSSGDQASCVDANGVGAEPINTLITAAQKDIRAAIVNTTAL